MGNTFQSVAEIASHVLHTIGGYEDEFYENANQEAVYEPTTYHYPRPPDEGGAWYQDVVEGQQIGQPVYQRLENIDEVQLDENNNIVGTFTPPIKKFLKKDRKKFNAMLQALKERIHEKYRPIIADLQTRQDTFGFDSVNPYVDWLGTKFPNEPDWPRMATFLRYWLSESMKQFKR
jgi:hypothetical protein